MNELGWNSLLTDYVLPLTDLVLLTVFTYTALYCTRHRTFPELYPLRQNQPAKKSLVASRKEEYRNSTVACLQDKTLQIRFTGLAGFLSLRELSSSSRKGIPNHWVFMKNKVLEENVNKPLTYRDVSLLICLSLLCEIVKYFCSCIVEIKGSSKVKWLLLMMHMVKTCIQAKTDSQGLLGQN